jgi:hypothetical protein
MAVEFLLMSPGFNSFLLLRDEQNSKCVFVCVCGGGGDVGGHKMHLFTANIPTFYLRYRKYVLITNEFHEFCWSTILGTLDDRKVSYGPKSMHIFNMSKIRHSPREYDMRGWCDTLAHWQSLGPTEKKWGRPAPHPWMACPVLAPFQILFFQCVKERQYMGYPIPKVSAAIKHGHPATQAG